MVPKSNLALSPNSVLDKVGTVPQVRCLMSATTQSLHIGVSTADKTILIHGANMRERERGRETRWAA